MGKKLTPQEKFNRQQMKKLQRLEVKGQKRVVITYGQARGANKRLNNQINKIDDSPSAIARGILNKIFG